MTWPFQPLLPGGAQLLAAGGALTLTVTSARISLAGSSVTLRVARKIAVTSAAITATGSSVTLKAGRKIAVSSAAITASGTSVAIKAARKLTCTSAAISLSGTSVTLTYTPVATGLTLTVTPAAISLTGSSVTLTSTTTPSFPTGTNFGFGYSDVQSIDDTRWKGVKEAREQAREAVEALGKPKRQKARKEAVREAIKAVEKTTVAVERYVETPRSSPALPDLSGVLDGLSSLEEMLRMYAEADRIRQADIEMARQQWIEVERQIAYEAFLEEELMVVMALAL